jgi:hypothetical protein
MFCLVDWFSFTVPLPAPIGGGGGDTFSLIYNIANESSGGLIDEALSLCNWSVSSGHGFYNVRYYVEGQGVSVSAGEVNAHALFEFSGVGCELLRSKQLLYPLIHAFADRATRVDLAVDMCTEVSPVQFVASSRCDRFKSRGSQNSPTGETEYIGSRKGERMARVYRYYPPHPRSHLLRAEVEYKGQAARVLADMLNEASLISVTLGAHEPFGWQHPAWTPGDFEASKLSFSRADKEAASTQRWLTSAVIPAVVRAEREGIMSWEAFKAAVDEKLNLVANMGDSGS